MHRAFEISFGIIISMFIASVACIIIGSEGHREMSIAGVALIVVATILLLIVSCTYKCVHTDDDPPGGNIFEQLVV